VFGGGTALASVLREGRCAKGLHSKKSKFPAQPSGSATEGPGLWFSFCTAIREPHTTWYRVAPVLAASHTVVCLDLRGFGQSSKPADTRDHSGSSKRAKARDCVALMKQLGFERFAIVGHDRGSYTAFRTAMDHPLAVTHLAVLDGVPIIEALERCTARFAQAWLHWFFFGQLEKPERAILADPDAWYGDSPDRMGAENYADYRAAIHDPATVHGMIEDYRAGLGIDRLHDEEDGARGGWCSALSFVSGRFRTTSRISTVMCSACGGRGRRTLRGHGINSGHQLAEEAPAELVEALTQFLRVAT
jgi:haloacetate dehalogenase